MNEYARYLFYLSVFNSAFSLATFIFAWWNTREKVIRSRFDGQSKELSLLSAEIADLKGKIVNPSTHCAGHVDLVKKQEDHATRMSQYKEILSVVENDLKHLPTVRDIEKLYARMDEFRSQVSNLQSEVSKISGAMPGVTHLIEMMNEFLLNHGGKQ